MRLRNRITLITLAALAGFLATRPDIRQQLSETVQELRSSFSVAIEQGRIEAAKKEEELTKEFHEV